MNFELPLNEEKVKPHQVTALHLLAGLALTGAGALIYLFQKSAAYWSIAVIIAGIALLYIGMFRNKWLIKKDISKLFRVIEFVLLAGIAVYSLLQRWTPPAVMFGVLSAAVLFAIFWEGGKGALLVVIDDAGVKLPVNTRRRFIAWQEIDQVLLKFGTLTINCHDNRLYQWSIGSINFDKIAFETFCNQQVEEGKGKRDKNDW